MRTLPAVGNRRRCPAILPAKCIGASDVLAVSLGFFREQSAGPSQVRPAAELRLVLVLLQRLWIYCSLA